VERDHTRGGRCAIRLANLAGLLTLPGIVPALRPASMHRDRLAHRSSLLRSRRAAAMVAIGCVCKCGVRNDVDLERFAAEIKSCEAAIKDFGRRG
jgi:hypothetical protein